MDFASSDGFRLQQHGGGSLNVSSIPDQSETGGSSKLMDCRFFCAANDLHETSTEDQLDTITQRCRLAEQKLAVSSGNAGGGVMVSLLRPKHWKVPGITSVAAVSIQDS